MLTMLSRQIVSTLLQLGMLAILLSIPNGASLAQSLPTVSSGGRIDPAAMEVFLEGSGIITMSSEGSEVSDLEAPVSNEGRVEHCIPAKVVSTNVPEFQGFKVVNRTVWTKVAPDVPCSVTRAVEKNTDLLVRHTEKGAEVRFAVTASSKAESLNMNFADFQANGSAQGDIALLVDGDYIDTGIVEILDSQVSWDGPTMLRLPSGIEIDYGFDEATFNRFVEGADQALLIGALEAARIDGLETKD